MPKPQSDPTPQVETKPTRTRTTGGLIGSAITRLTAINAAEQDELQASPQSIRLKYQKRREALFSELEPGIVEAVKAACQAMGAKPEAAE
jgi:hypothetical protein